MVTNSQRLAMLALLLLAYGGCASNKPIRTEGQAKQVGRAVSESPAAFETTVRGPEHKLLMPFVGEWETEARFWMAADRQAMISHGRARSRWVLDNMFLFEDFAGEIQGQKFQGIGILGFDRARKQFTSVCLDSTNTAIGISYGTADQSGKTFEFHGTYTDPDSRAEKELRSVLRLITKDRHQFEMFERAPGGKEFRTLEIVYTRARR